MVLIQRRRATWVENLCMLSSWLSKHWSSRGQNTETRIFKTDCTRMNSRSRPASPWWLHLWMSIINSFRNDNLLLLLRLLLPLLSCSCAYVHVHVGILQQYNIDAGDAGAAERLRRRRWVGVRCQCHCHVDIERSVIFTFWVTGS